ncbi:hypothetical protein [Mechercharimyces sp. CAU 1602]|uniref:hypothetical protein n=1 Tax=Mechercharimyces sp. CAU 1602 TaxID=2973933 RepID=UPI002162EF4A|nr:hypothetical protein [Mechercharimyces sp. CAU 1602]
MMISIFGFYGFVLSGDFGQEGPGYFMVLVMFSSLIIFFYGLPVSIGIDKLVDKKLKGSNLASFILHLLASVPLFFVLYGIAPIITIVMWLIDRGLSLVIRKRSFVNK